VPGPRLTAGTEESLPGAGAVRQEAPVPSGTGAGPRVEPAWPGVGGPGGPGEGLMAEGRLDRRAHGVNVDADRRQRAPVQVTEQATAGETCDFRLDAPGRGAVLTQDGSGRLDGGGQGQQEVLATEVGVTEPDGILVGPHPDGDGVRGHVSRHGCLHIVSIC
jgi:hypothetical protein